MEFGSFSTNDKEFSVAVLFNPSSVSDLLNVIWYINSMNKGSYFLRNFGSFSQIVLNELNTSSPLSSFFYISSKLDLINSSLNGSNNLASLNSITSIKLLKASIVAH